MQVSRSAAIAGAVLAVLVIGGLTAVRRSGDSTPAAPAPAGDSTLMTVSPADSTPVPVATATISLVDPVRTVADPPSAGPAAGVAMRSTLAGVYTVEQATRGAEIYVGMCISCHAGLGNHVGAVFRQSWGGLALGEMFEYLKADMPKNDPGGLADTEYVDVMAYLLQLNGMPPGRAPLPADAAALRQIRLDTARAGGTTDR